MIVESVVRSAIAYPKAITGEPQQYDEFIDAHPSSNRIRMIKELYSFLRACACDIYDLSPFLTCDEIIQYYSFLQAHSSEVGLSEKELQQCSLRKEIAIMLMEVTHFKSQRYSLRPTPRSGIVFNCSAAYDHLATLVKQYSFGEANDETKCMCYCCYVMGYYSFFQQNWGNAQLFWNLSNYHRFHWEESTISLLQKLIANRRPMEEPSQPQTNAIDFSALPIKPCKSYSETLKKHACLSSLENAPSPTVLVHYIQFHLSEWSNATSYFSNTDLRLNKESCYCFMMCLYLCGAISELIAMNQYISFCNYSDVEMMLKSNDIDDACIAFYSDVPLLQLLIHIYADRSVTCKKAEHTFHLLMEQMKKPIINAFNDEMILSQEKLNLQKRLFRYLYWRFLIELSPSSVSFNKQLHFTNRIAYDTVTSQHTRSNSLLALKR